MKLDALRIKNKNLYDILKPKICYQNLRNDDITPFMGSSCCHTTLISNKREILSSVMYYYRRVA
jgi:hypothetical protein